MKSILFSATLLALINNVSAQITFSNQTTLLPTQAFYSGNSIGVCDMNNDGKDDIVRAWYSAQQYVELQQAANDTFTEMSTNAYIGDPWGMCVGDIDNDGFNDPFWGDGNGPGFLLHWNGTGYTSYNLNGMAGFGYDFPQGVNMFDIDQDSKLDAFLCNDNMMSYIYHGNGTATGFTNGLSMISLATVPASDNSGNYAALWTDINNDGYIDLHITHCRQGVTNFSDPRRIDQIFINNGNGTYTQDVTNWTGLQDGAQGWCTASGDIDNDGDMDLFVTDYDIAPKFWINNGNGTFTDIYATSGITSYPGFVMNATFHDFDNDGYTDLMTSGYGPRLYRNNGNSTFTLVSNILVHPVGGALAAHAIGDLNSDGLLDVYGSYCNLYQSPSGYQDLMWMNTTSTSNHYVMFDLVGGAVTGFSNRNGIGAIVKIYGPWGVQTREVRSGEGYGIQNSFIVHFGLGANTTIDSTVILWPSGIVDHPTLVSIDGHTTVNEGAFPTSTSNAFYHPLRMTFGPNPMQEQLTVNLYNADSYGLENITVELFDVNGKLVHTQVPGSNSFVIERGSLSKGMYVLNVRFNEKVLATEKLIVD